MTKIIGHRGARGLAPENTIKAIEAALQHHVDGIEIDVRVTKDGKVILSHNPAITGLTIRQHTYDELKAAKPDIATLEEAITAIGSSCPLRIEIKPKEPVTPIAAIVRQALKTNSKTNLLILSKSQAVLRQAKTELPGVPLVVIERWSGVRAHWRMRQLDTNLLQMNKIWLWRGFLWGMHRQGIHMVPYTINDPKLLKRWAPYIDGIITDYPDRFEHK